MRWASRSWASFLPPPICVARPPKRAAPCSASIRKASSPKASRAAPPPSPRQKPKGVSSVDLPSYMLDAEQFRLILDCAPDAIVVVNHQGRLVLVNEHAEQMFGRRREELVGRPVEELLPGIKGAAESVALRRSGETFPVEVTRTPIRTYGDTWIAAGIRDLTERKLAEERLIAERRRAEE